MTQASVRTIDMYVVSWSSSVQRPPGAAGKGPRGHGHFADYAGAVAFLQRRLFAGDYFDESLNFSLCKVQVPTSIAFGHADDDDMVKPWLRANRHLFEAGYQEPKK